MSRVPALSEPLLDANAQSRRQQPQDGSFLPACFGLTPCSVSRASTSGTAASLDQFVQPGGGQTKQIRPQDSQPMEPSPGNSWPPPLSQMPEHTPRLALLNGTSPQQSKESEKSTPRSGKKAERQTSTTQTQTSGPSHQHQTNSGKEQESDMDIVQFSSPIYFVEENERKLIVDVMRLGTMHGKIKVKYYTEDASAEAGERYDESSGQLVFNDGEHSKPIVIKILEDDHFQTTTEFKIHLKEPERCEMGVYLHFCRVKVIDNSLFPSSKFRDAIEEGEEEIEKINSLQLFKEFFKLAIGNKGMTRRCCLALLFDQMKNIYVFLTLYINVYLVDVLFNDEAKDELWLRSGPEDGRLHTAALIGLLYVVPNIFIHIWDYARIRLDIAGGTREFLQLNLFRKYLNYSEDSRTVVAPSTMQVAVTSDCAELAAGFEASLNVIHHVGKLAVLVYFILQENPNALLPVVVMPTTMIMWVILRNKIMSEWGEKKSDETKRVIDIVSEACNKYRLIADYQQRPQVCDLFQERSEKLGHSIMGLEIVQMNNRKFAAWLGPLFIGYFIATKAQAVLDGDLKLGVFLATVRIFNELSEQFSEAYEELMEVSSAIGPLRKLCLLFNAATDLMLWKQTNRKRREMSKMARLEVLYGDEKAAPGLKSPISTDRGGQSQETGKSSTESATGMKPRKASFKGRPSIKESGGFRTDRIELKLRGVTYSYRGGVVPVLSSVSVSVPQGHLVAVIGKHGSGKSTLLRLLGHNIFPLEGEIFIPTHLRILHVTQEPMMLDVSVWANLTFGRPHADPKRVRAILQALKMVKTEKLMLEDLEKMNRMSELGEKEKNEDSFDKTKDDDDDEDLEHDSDSDAEAIQDEGFEAAKWQDQLSYAEKARIHLARALIVNPEVMVLHRPMSHFDEDTAALFMKVLLEHVQNRGFQVPSARADRRRPRTCFFSPSNNWEAKQADVVWSLDSHGKVTPVTPEEFESWQGNMQIT